MSSDFTIRRARPDEAEFLGNMTLEGLYYWGYKQDFPEIMEDFRKENLPKPDYISESPVYILENDTQRIGYYGLHVDERGFIDLRYLFLDTDFIGKGYGKTLWNHAVGYAKSQGFERMRIISDPKAVGFYAAMGAQSEGTHTVQPGFDLTIFWFELA